MCDFIVVMKIYWKDVYNLYSNPSTSFKSLVFHSFTPLVEWRHENIVLKLITKLSTIIDHMVFKCFGQHIWTRHYDMITTAQVRLTRQVFSNVIFWWNNNVTLGLWPFVDELEAMFLVQMVVDALGI